MAAKNSPATEPAEPVLVITRVFDAPPSVVFKAWTEPERLMRWWGPKGFATPFCKIDLRPGGVFHYCMRSPEGRDYWGKSVYREIVAPERIVFINSFSDEEGNPVRNPHMPDWPLETLVTLTFAEHKGRTTLTIQSVALSATASERKTFEAGRDMVQQGWASSLDRLAEELAKA